MLCRDSVTPAQEVGQTLKYLTFLAQRRTLFSEKCLCPPPILLRGSMVEFAPFGTFCFCSAFAVSVGRAASSKDARL